MNIFAANAVRTGLNSSAVLFLALATLLGVLAINKTMPARVETRLIEELVLNEARPPPETAGPLHTGGELTLLVAKYASSRSKAPIQAWVAKKSLMSSSGKPR